MDEKRYRIVFRGDIGLGYDQSEIRQNLSRLTRWDEKKIDQLLASNHCIIKGDLDAAAAERMLNALNNTGILCKREEIPVATPVNNTPVAPATIAVVGRAAVAVNVAVNPCPKCGHPRDGGLSCPACGVVFAKFGQPQAVAVSKPGRSVKGAPAHVAELQRSAKRRRNDPISKLDQSHPLGFFLGKFFLVIIGALFLRTLYNADLTMLLLLVLPVGFILYLGALSSVTERPVGELFVDHLSLLPILSSDRERRNTAFPFATYLLIILQIVIYLGFQLSTPLEILREKWFFLPVDSSGANLLLSACASLFMHASGFAFLGTLLFLWIIGATVEKRIGSFFVLLLYFLCGLFAVGLGFGFQRLFVPEPQLIMGAGGALAGLMGAFVIRSHLRSLVFPLPFFGLDILLVGVPYQVRWSSLLVTALLVLADLNAPVESVAGSHNSLGLVILFGGLCSGLLAAVLFGLGSEAGDEEDEDVSTSKVFTVDEGVMRRRLEENPDNPDLQLQLARVIAEKGLTDEARQLYRQSIIARLASKPKEAAEIFREFTLRYQESFEAKLTLRLAALYLRLGEMGMSASVLYPVCDDADATPEEREKAMYQYAVTIARLGQIEEAYTMLKRFANEFPESTLLQKLRELVYDAAQKEQK